MKKILNTGPSPRGWHRLQTVLQCPQKYAWKFEMGMDRRPTDSPALIKGTMMHLILAQHYYRLKNATEGQDPDEWEEPRIALKRQAEEEEGRWDPFLEQIETCFDAYLSHYKTDNFKVLEVERLAWGQIDEHTFTGRFDLVMEDVAGRVWVVDHKTTARLLKRQIQYYGVSGQLIGYSYLAKQIYGDRFHGMLLNQIQHTGKFNFQRLSLPPAPYLLERFPQTVRDAEERIAQLKKSGRSPLEWPMAMNEMTCYGRYGACDFLENCKWGTGG